MAATAALVPTKAVTPSVLPLAPLFNSHCSESSFQAKRTDRRKARKRQRQTGIKETETDRHKRDRDRRAYKETERDGHKRDRDRRA
jgi:hypothetical protein